jgi:hypothetical protein
MLHTKRRAYLTVAILLSLPAAAQPAQALYPPGSVPAVVSKIDVGEMVGVSYSDGQYLLWATPAEETHATIFSDEIIQLARLALEIGDEKGAGFSLDFTRRGASAFNATDILAPALFGAMLGSKQPLAVMLRGMPEGNGIAQELASESGKKPDKQLLKRAAALLNRARECDLTSLALPAFLSPETRSLLASGKAERSRLSRMVLEDTFSPALQRDVEQRYVIQYKPGDISAKAAALLNGTRSEAILLAADSALKFLTAGKVGGELAIGPSQMVLCGEQARTDLLRGAEPQRGEYVNFFSLDLEYDRMQGATGVWMRDTRLITHADGVTGGQTPSCAMRYAANLTAKMRPILQRDGEIPQELRDLRALLVLHRALVFLSNCAPMSPARLKKLAVDSERLPNIPPKVVRDPLAIAADGKSMVFTVSGGVLFGNTPAPLPDVSPGLAAHRSTRPDVPGFLVTGVRVGERSLLQIDISSILAPL